MRFFDSAFWQAKDPMQKFLYIFVPLAHLLLLCFAVFASPPQKQSHKKLAVKTFVAPSVSARSVPLPKAAVLPQKTSNAQAQAPKKPTQSANKPKPKPKAPPISKTPLKKEAPLKEPAKKKKPHLAQHLKEIEERIAKIEGERDRMPSNAKLPVPATFALTSQAPLPLLSMAVSQQVTTFEEDKVALLIGHMQACLHLPELGEVQMELVLHKDGKIKTMKVMKAESQKNKKYLEDHLPQILFPPSYVDGLSSEPLLITFCNK